MNADTFREHKGNRPNHIIQTFGRLETLFGVILAVIVFLGSPALAQSNDSSDPSSEPGSSAVGQSDEGVQSQPSPPTEVSDANRNPADASPDSPAAEVIEVSGSVEQAEAGVSPLIEEGWTPVKVGDSLPPGTQIRTGLRSHVNLRFGETTVMSIRSATHASIDEFYRSATSENVRIGLGYGAVRGSSSEGVLRSDVTVDSTVATLAKRGTEGWEMSVEPMTGRFSISLAQSGLVEATRKMRGQRRVARSVRPGEYATRNNIANMWIAQAVFDRNVAFYEASSITASDAEFTTYNSSGLGVVAAGGGSQLTDASGRADAGALIREAMGRFTIPPRTTVIQPGLLARPEGHFGTPNTFRIFVPQEKRAVRSALSAIRPGMRRPR